MTTDDLDCRCLICEDHGDGLDDADARLVATVSDPGWGVLTMTDDETDTVWAFTVGLWHSFRAPEVAMFGLRPPTMTRCLNHVGNLVADGRTLAAGDDVGAVFGDGLPSRLTPVDAAWHKILFGTSVGFYGSTLAVPFLQLLWPDPNSRFPGEPGFAPEFTGWQPMLWLGPDRHPAGTWTAQV
ncbi:MAG TPA: DUF4262 domain-containing protein [Actinokineospora sp.]|nr:DUF4262 domain-containing protein [Actinokineospora sp.]